MKATEKLQCQMGRAGTQAAGTAASLASKYWTFNQIDRGDCTIFPGGVFTLYADGSTNWRCDIKSTDSGDEWDGDFISENQGHTQLWSDHYHFDISDENQVKRWDDSRGPNAARANAFQEAYWLSFRCDC
jgi:hypothetical protein